MRESCGIAEKGVGEAGKSSDRVVLEWKRVRVEKSDRAGTFRLLRSTESLANWGGVTVGTPSRRDQNGSVLNR